MVIIKNFNSIAMSLLLYFTLLSQITYSQPLIVQSTTSTLNSGFFDYILPIINNELGINAHIVGAGTGAAIKNDENCDGDVLIVHAREHEEKFVESGFGLKRENLMYNDFVIVGPSSDPVKIINLEDIISVFKKIASNRHFFISRGDESGTNIKELKIWELAGVDLKPESGKWYYEVGAGMGSALNIAIQLNAYVLTDRATWISFKNKSNFKILFEGDDLLFNQYGIISINPSHCPNTKYKKAKKFIDWLISKQGQDKIKQYILKGEQLFFPNHYPN